MAKHTAKVMRVIGDYRIVKVAGEGFELRYKGTKLMQHHDMLKVNALLENLLNGRGTRVAIMG